MSTAQRTTEAEAIWMVLHDRKTLAKLMLAHGITQRDLATAAGWSSHSYLGRLLRGQVTTLEPEPAVRIAHHLGVPLESLFVSRTSSDTTRNGKGTDAA